MLWRRRCCGDWWRSTRQCRATRETATSTQSFFSSGREEERKQVAALRLVITSEVSGLDGAYHAAEGRPERQFRVVEAREPFDVGHYSSSQPVMSFVRACNSTECLSAGR